MKASQRPSGPDICMNRAKTTAIPPVSEVTQVQQFRLEAAQQLHRDETDL
jgi:hypothetical protein